MHKEKAPLDGLRVLELGHIVAGPSASMMLAELGAEVVKVEHPDTGDTGRSMPNKGSTFYFLNRNKKSIALDLKREEGLAVFGRLVAKFDVVIDNYAPGALDRLGIGYEWGRKQNPRVIYCSIKGYLPGPKFERPSLDELAQMEGGLAYMTGPQGKPMRAGASIVDIGAATYGVLGVLAALLERERTGRGQSVISGLFETTTFWVGQHVSKVQMFRGDRLESVPMQGMGSMMGWGVYQLFPTRDGREIFIAVTTNRHFERLCRALGLEDLLGRAEYSNNSKRVANKVELAEIITETVSSQTGSALCEILQNAGVPYAEVNSPADLLDDPQATANMLSFEVPELDELKVPKLPMSIGDFEYEVRCGPPRLGEHTRDVLQAVGYATAEIDDMLAKRVAVENGPMINPGMKTRGRK